MRAGPAPAGPTAVVQKAAAYEWDADRAPRRAARDFAYGPHPAHRAPPNSVRFPVSDRDGEAGQDPCPMVATVDVDPGGQGVDDVETAAVFVRIVVRRALTGRYEVSVISHDDPQSAVGENQVEGHLAASVDGRVGGQFSHDEESRVLLFGRQRQRVSTVRAAPRRQPTSASCAGSVNLAFTG